MANKPEMIAEGIKKTMEHAIDWEKRKTSIPGIFLVRMPDKRFRVMLSFNPLDPAGAPRKRKGWFFADMDTVRAARQVFPDKRLDMLVAAVEKVNLESKRKGEDEDIFQV